MSAKSGQPARDRPALAKLVRGLQEVRYPCSHDSSADDGMDQAMKRPPTDEEVRRRYGQNVVVLRTFPTDTEIKKEKS